MLGDFLVAPMQDAETTASVRCLFTNAAYAVIATTARMLKLKKCALIARLSKSQENDPGSRWFINGPHGSHMIHIQAFAK
jgi:hypothetical protein